ncbi:MAG: DUF3592 domain-containing protein [Candidatus Acidiferrales bacterium]
MGARPGTSVKLRRTYAIIRVMDWTLLSVVIVTGGAVLVAIGAWIVSWRRESKLLQKTRDWPTTEATVESGALESTQESGKEILPTFAINYQVAGEYYGGRFCLIPEKRFPGAEFIQTLMKGMIGRKLLVRYDPKRPQVWFLPDESIDGCKVGQRVGLHVVHSLYPKE